MQFASYHVRTSHAVLCVGEKHKANGKDIMFPESVILVVGSESEEFESVAELLAGGYRVIGAEKPDDALTYAADGVNLVICQLDSPEFSGLQFLRKWRSRNGADQTPFIFVTDGSDVTSAIEVMKLGAADCLVKPVDGSQLRDSISKALDDTHASSQRDGGSSNDIDIPPGTSLEHLERVAVEKALEQHQGNRTHAAKTLGISVRTLQRKLKAWGLPLLTSSQPQQQAGSNSSILYSSQNVHSQPPFSAHAH